MCKRAGRHTYASHHVHAQEAPACRLIFNHRRCDLRDWQVDTHVHHSACMHQKHLLRFIKSKLRKEPGEVVIFRDGKYLTLLEVFESLNLTGYACLLSTAASAQHLC